ncbi:hypothetical protein AAEU32_14770 [Pseudoalteromonas sp. SSDWG2]|uniref:hypothetical protein n=1 Tax=Pseudoalteromonas sp. SSDWG2 TaxID=3139391 RepID=UPI003BAC815E
MVHSNLKMLSAIVLASALSTGCTLVGEHKYTGGGTMASAGGDKNAVFTFNVENCDGEDVKGRVNYIDHSAIDFENIGGVSLNAQVDNFGYCTIDIDGFLNNEPLCNCENQYEAQFSYSSKNPSAQGDGTGFVCFFDTGEGKGNFHGAITAFYINDGPYAGYINYGTVNGNIQQHSCPASDE